MIRLSKQIGPSHTLLGASTSVEFVRGLRRGDVDVVVLDPVLEPQEWSGTVHLSLASVLLTHARSAAVVIYSEPSQLTMTVLASLSRSHAVEFVARGWRDEFDQLRGALTRAMLASRGGDTGVLLSERVEELLGQIPRQLAHAIQFAIEQPEQVRSVRVFSTIAGRSQRTIERWLRDAGLACAMDFLSAARTARAHRLLSQPEHRISHVARALNYASESSFRDSVQRMTLCTPSVLRTQPPEAVAQRLMARLRNSRSGPARAVRSETAVS